MSIYAQRQIQRQQNFLAGRSRSAYRLPLPLEQSRVQESTVVPASSASSSHAHRTPSCKRGCPQVLSSLKAAFDASGLHPAKQHQKRVASYPIPKQKLAHRNIRGKTVIITAIIMHKTNTMILHSTPHTQVHAQWKALKCKPRPCLHQVPNCYLVVYMHVSGAKRYQICNNDVTARLNLEESHHYSFRRISASDVIMT